jgi:iron-sulfur cluster assembly accessory protein
MDTKIISRDMTIEEIFSEFPQHSQRLAQELTNAGLNCVGCGASTWETLEMGMLGHGFSEEKIDGLIGKLNGILDEKMDLETISMTPKAAAKFREILEDEGKAGWALRFGSKVGGCSGFEYFLDYSEKAGPDDVVFPADGVEIHVERDLAPRLMGSVIDFVDGLNGSGFKITNPNVKGSCGCGKSQSY